MTDSDFYSLCASVARLVEGLEGGSLACLCGKKYRLGLTLALREALPSFAAEAKRRAGLADTVQPTRFGLLEVD